MGVFSRDTCDRIERIQMDAYRSMTPEERNRLVVDLSDTARRIALDGLRARNPDASNEVLMRLFVEQVLGLRFPSQMPGEDRQ